MKNLCIILILTIIFGCQQHAKNEYNEFISDKDEGLNKAFIPPMQPNEGPQGKKTENISALTTNIYPKKIIKDGRISIDVKNIYVAKQRIDSLTSKYNGYISRESFNNYSYGMNFSILIRLPADSFETLIYDLENGTGEITSKNIDARDVTEEFIDLKKRLENKRKYDTKYSELLKQARTIKDILDIQEKQRVIQEEIESTEGRLKYLNSQVSFSSLNLELNQKIEFKYKPEKKDKFSQRFQQSMHKGWQTFIDFVLFLFKLWPFWLVSIVVWQIIKKIRNKKKLKN